MRLILLKVGRRLNLSVLEMFETAWVWRFDKEPVVIPDYCNYLTHGILPKYVIEWVNHVKGDMP